MRICVFSKLSISLFLLTFLSSCSLYESSGREAIEKNQGGIVVSGFSFKPNAYYECSRSYVTPEFLKEPLEVIDADYEKQNISVLFSERSTPNWVVVYYHNPLARNYDSCKIFFLKQVQSDAQILEAAQLGVSQLRKFSSIDL